MHASHPLLFSPQDPKVNSWSGSCRPLQPPLSPAPALVFMLPPFHAYFASSGFLLGRARPGMPVPHPPLHLVNLFFVSQFSCLVVPSSSPPLTLLLPLDWVTSRSTNFHASRVTAPPHSGIVLCVSCPTRLWAAWTSVLLTGRAEGTQQMLLNKGKVAPAPVLPTLGYDQNM